MKAKIAAKYAEAKAANDAAAASSAATSDLCQTEPPRKKPAKVFARGDAVICDNPKNGRLEFAHVIEVHTYEGEAEYYTVETKAGEERQVEGNCLSSSSWSAPRVFDDEPPAGAVIHVHPYAPPGPRIGIGHRHYNGKRNHHGPKQIHVPSLNLTVRGVGGNAKKKAYGGYAAWKKSLLGK